MKITFLGGGNMAAALIGGLLDKGFSAADVQVIDINETSRIQLHSRFGVRAVVEADPDTLACDVLVLAVKPQQMQAAITSLSGLLSNVLVISIAAGLRLEVISRWLGGYRQLVRCMPNTPALIGAGVSGLFADASVDDVQRLYAEKILGAVGSTVWVETEEQLDVVTAVSGSGPAYVFHFIEALEAAGTALGLEPETARRLTLDTVLGAARLAVISDESAAVLRQRVTSKGGTTEAALNALAAKGWHDTLVQAVQAAAIRSQQLGDELDKDKN